jgi:hypothetical protein
MTDVPILLDNSGNDVYSMASLEFLTNPIRTDLMKVLLGSTAQLENIIKIRNFTSFGSESNRDISLKKFISALDKTNLIVDVILNPPVILDGQTYFQTDIEPNSELGLLFFYDQFDLVEFLK